MTEIEKMKRAKTYLDSIVNGYNPLNGEPIAPSDILMNDRISKCLQYVSLVLARDISAMLEEPPLPEDIPVYENPPMPVYEEPAVNETPAQPEPAAAQGNNGGLLSAEQIAAITANAGELSATKVASKINEYLGEGQQITNFKIINFFEDNGMLYSDRSSGKTRKRPTEAGTAIGIGERTITENGEVKPYCVYNASAQEYICRHIDEIV